MGITINPPSNTPIVTSAPTSAPTSTPTSATTSVITSTPTKTPTLVPTKESSDNCRDDPDFRYKNDEDSPCEKVPKNMCNKWDKVTKKMVKFHCPVHCGFCNDSKRCINPNSKIPVKVAHRKKKIKVSCDLIPIMPLVDCTDVISKKNISNLCPGSCDLCNQW